MSGVRVPNHLGNMNAHRRLTALRFGIMSAVCSIALTMIAADQITVLDSPVSGANRFYLGNRAPLAPSPFVMRPNGSIAPRGWLRHQLELERDGMIGRLKEISPWLDFQKSAWASEEGKGERGWEEMPYWLKGYGDLGYVLHDEMIIAEEKKWIEAA